MSQRRPNPQAIELDRRIIFLHIPKTAGTSIVRFFRNRLPAEQVSSHGDFTKIRGTQAERLAALSRFRFLSGHFGYDDVAELLPESYSFTFLRDPIDRSISLFRFMTWPKAQELIPSARVAMELGVENFFSSARPMVTEIIENTQTWHLAANYWHQDRQLLSHLGDDELLAMAKEHLASFDLVGTTETFDADFAQILRELDISEPPSLIHHHKTPKTMAEQTIPDAAIQAIRERTPLDSQLYDYVCELRGTGG
ncbi:MAG: sulfotransferase family 2 domain-containing protein [Pseudomonadota bacterium]